MNLFNQIVVGYFIVIGVLVHCSLFFCTEEHCVYEVTALPISREWAYYMRISISNLIPVSFATIQIVAQWLILFELILLLGFIVSFIRRIVSFLC
jgi:hypothetical protein